ncbi:MAG TPA: GTPase Era [Solimonas sp.]
MRSGIVTLVGRPNVGKSSLLNAMVGHKVSIVSHKPQTTRHRIQGVLHQEQGQIVFVDTPGLHRQQKRALNRVMNEAAVAAIQDVDLIVFVVEAGVWTEEDQAVFERLQHSSAPVGLVINKIDRVKERARLLPELERLGKRHAWAFVVPLSALKGDNLRGLETELFARLPEGPPLYPEDQIVGHDLGFTAAEIVREKLTRSLHQELPYALTVEIEQYQREGGLDRISAVIWVERDNQKKIVIGENGEHLKRIGSAARRDLERETGQKVFLQLWCKVRENWSDDPKALKRFGLSLGD